ncbi:hypothetical protein CVIRNUC_004644 [Coccomyxa viridis]|uniref:JmjC domain-containing protein n=1 Tax=Coccomyxa viridis TaxID=1274662 RepID=A0AAV1I221_9CHLO|nr:hypothetical protein CVIRNUC_004644 [Coccomyxa viridis]
MPRISRRKDGSASILAEPLAVRLERNGAPACAVSFADDGLAGKHMAGLPGISTPFAILSWPFTSALLHCEDAGLGAYNLLLSGAAKIWYIIPASKETAFLQYLKEAIPNGMGLSYIKQLLPQIPLAQMAALGAVRIVQKPGQAVVTCPGLVFHFTLSCGTSEAEATNYYLDSPDTTFVDIWRRWCQYARDCTLDLRMLPRPDSRPSQWLQSVCDDRNHIAWTIGEWMELSEEEFVNAPAPDKWGRAEELAQDARLCASGTAHAEKLQLPTAPVPEMRDKVVVTASTGRAENPERVIDSSTKPKSTARKQPDMRNLSVACHKAKRAKPSVKPDEISQVEFDAFMASLKKTLFDSTVPKAKYTEMKQERDELLSRNAALEKRCADAEELLEGFNSSLTSLQATWTAKAKAFTDAHDS